MEIIIPDLQGCVMCEDVRQEINGMQTIVGVVNVVPAPKLPLTFFKICIWTRWCSGQGRFEQRSRIMAPDEEQIIGEAQVNFQLTEIESHATNVHCFGGLQIHHYGVHHVEISLNSELRLRFPLSVVKVGA